MRELRGKSSLPPRPSGPIDALGNPLIRVNGCPNCGKGRASGWTSITYAAGLNSGRKWDGPCSRSCALQIDYAKTLPPRPVR
jgi:hypothetical protein